MWTLNEKKKNIFACIISSRCYMHSFCCSCAEWEKNEEEEEEIIINGISAKKFCSLSIQAITDHIFILLSTLFFSVIIFIVNKPAEVQ